MTAQKQRRTWPQRLTLGLVIIIAIACLATAAGLATGQWVLSQRNLVALGEPTSVHDASAGSPTVILPGATTTTPSDPDDPDAPTTTIMLAEPAAANFLIVGADNNACLGDVEPTIGDRQALGERSDTIMIWRANPQADQLAVLSLPRDLYVDIAGGRKARINSAFERDDPTRLIDTIFLNFGIPIDHYVQVDFCAFERLVDAVGGVPVPFEYPTRDRNSGLFVPEAGCVTLDGSEALAYVRSRHYQYEDPPGSDNWITDGTSDFGRIARQQDFLRRVIARVINEGLYSPNVASALITANRDYLVTDTELTVRRMLEFANTLRRLDPSEITTYRIESASSTTDSGDQVEYPRIDGGNMKAILSVFRGEATLASAPEQVFELSDTTTVAPEPTTVTDSSTVDSSTVDSSTSDSSTGEPPTTLPQVEAEQNNVGIAPDANISCG
jgi:LCP family protein required for cell wall assembly